MPGRSLPALFLVIIALLALLFLAGCGGGSSSSNSGSGRTGSASIKVNWPAPSRLIPAATASIKVDILDATNLLLDSKLLVRPSGTLQMTVTFTNLPPGNHRATATAFPNPDGTGTALATATTSLVITAGHTTNFTIAMGSTITQIDVTPSTYQLNQGQTITLTATPRDANGNVVMIAPSQLAWVSSAPSIATVTATGATVTVTGVGIGTAQISVTETESQKFNQFPMIVLPVGGHLYTITDLPVPAGKYVDVKDMNENGDVLGNIITGAVGTSRTFSATVWKADGTQLTLPLYPGSNARFRGYGINDAGLVIGLGPVSPYAIAAVFDPAVGTYQALPDLPNGFGSIGTGINNSGQAVGIGDFGTHSYALFWENGVVTQLPALPSSNSDHATNINNVGQVVGWGYIGGHHRAFLWDSRTNALQNLGTLGGNESTPTGINTQGVVVGYAQITGSQFTHAFLWQNGTMTDLGLLPGYLHAYARAINDNGEVVGTDYVGPNSVPWHWKNGTMIDLTTRVVNGTGWTLLSADAINNQGKIAGTGLHNGQPAAYLLTPQ